MASLSGAIEEERRIYRKIAWRIMPFLFLGYIINYLDRTNVGIAALQMNQDLGFSPTIYATGAAIFFIPYALAEVPSNLIMQRVGARIWIGRIMITWGLIAAAMALVVGPNSFYALRFFLGLAEAGYAPAVLFYLTLWFPRSYLARAQALILVGSPLSSVFGSPLSGALLGMNGIWGLTGWQWLFIVEGLPAAILGVVAFFLLCDKPQDAKWLTDDEKSKVVKAVEVEEAAREREHNFSLAQTFVHPKLWMVCLCNFLWAVGFFGFLFWLPQIIRAFGNLSNFQVSLLNALPALFGAVSLWYFATRSDKHAERGWHAAIPLFIAAAGLVASTAFDIPTFSMACLIVAGIGFYGFVGVFYSLAPEFLKRSNAAGGIALVTTMGNVGGFVGPYVVGLLRESMGNFKYALLVCALSLILGGLVATTLSDKKRSVAAV